MIPRSLQDNSVVRHLTVLLLCAFLGVGQARAGSMTLLGVGGPTAGASYSGPGDSQTFIVWGSVARVYNLAKASTATSLADLVASTGGAAVCTLRGTTAGTVDLAASYCAGTTPALACAAASGGSCKVSKLYDQVGTNPWIQATLSKMPTLVFSSIGGFPSMSFASANSQTLGSTNAITQSQTFSYLAVANHQASSAAGQEILSSDTSEVDLAFQGTNLGANTITLYAGGGVVTATASDTSAHVLQSTLAGASSTINVDGAGQATGNAGAFNIANKLWIGSFNDSSLYLDGLVSEVGMYASSYNSSVQSNARTRYGL